MFLMVILGGPGYLFGPVLGSFIGVFAPEWLRFTEGWYLLLFGAVIVLLMRWMPGGLLSLRQTLAARREAKAHEAARRQAVSQARSGACIPSSASDRSRNPMGPSKRWEACPSMSCRAKSSG